MEFAEQLRMIRQRMFLSQDEFAKVLHVSLSTENRGGSKPNLTAMKHPGKQCPAARWRR